MSIVPSPPANATPTARGLMSAADKAKLDGIPPGGGSSVVTSVTQANGLTLTASDLAMGAASAAAPGAVTTGAQEFAGAKTLTGAILTGITTIAEAVTSLVRAVGASLVLRSSLGAGASDVAVKVGTSETDAGTNTSAKLLSVRTGLGGTEVEKAYFTKSGALVVPTAQPTNTPALLLPSPQNEIGVGYSGAIKWGISSSYILDSQQAFTIYSYSVPLMLRSPFSSVQLVGGLGGAGDLGVKIGSRIDAASFNATARLASFRTGILGTETEHAFVTKTDVELTAVSGGIVLRSPDGTRYRLTVANGGTLSITAA